MKRLANRLHMPMKGPAFQPLEDLPMQTGNPKVSSFSASSTQREGYVTPAKFSVSQVTALRQELLQRGVDHFQAAEIINSFVASGGYGISQEMARHIALRLERMHDGIESLHRQLEICALAM
jgi:hypothetical protein